MHVFPTFLEITIFLIGNHVQVSVHLTLLFLAISVLEEKKSNSASL